jgi:putative copper export protein
MDVCPGNAIAVTTSRFSTLAGFCVAMVLITGVYNAWVEVGRPHLLAETHYGHILIVKMVLFCLLILFGTVNR